MEYFDVVDKFGNPTGETISRSDAHALGVRHRTAHIWVVRRLEGKYQVLLQRRSFDKDCFPGLLDTSSAGHIKAGDEPFDSALRELEEELSIKATKDDLQYMGQFIIQYEKIFYKDLFKDNEISFVYLYEKTVDIESLTIQKEELDSVGWFDLEETIENVKKHHPDYCVPIGGIELLNNYLIERKR